MKKHIVSLTKHFLIFAFTLCVLWSLLVLTALIPNSALSKNYEKSVYYYSDKDAFEFTNKEKLNSVADHYADSIWLNVAWNIGTDNPIKSSIQTNYYNGEEAGENAGLYYTVMKGKSPNDDYTRYWHGTAIFIRLFHLFTDVEGVKNIGFAFFLILTALTVFIILRRGHWDLALMLTLSLASVQIWNIRLSIEYQPSFIIAFAIIPLLLILERKSDKWFTVLSVISGTLVAFFDFLTTETVTILLPLALAIAIRAKEKRLGDLKQNIILIFKCGLCWLCAYVATFIVKWIIVSIMADSGAFIEALKSAGVHSAFGNIQEIDVNNRPKNLISGILANLTVIFGGNKRVEILRVALGLSICFSLIFSLLYVFRRKPENRDVNILFWIIGGMVFVRFLVLNNHSFVHEFFVYRALVTTVFVLMTGVWLCIDFLPQRRRRK